MLCKLSPLPAFLSPQVPLSSTASGSCCQAFWSDGPRRYFTVGGDYVSAPLPGNVVYRGHSVLPSISQTSSSVGRSPALPSALAVNLTPCLWVAVEPSMPDTDFALGVISTAHPSLVSSSTGPLSFLELLSALLVRCDQKALSTMGGAVTLPFLGLGRLGSSTGKIFHLRI